MGTESIDYLAVLADMEAKRAALDSAITHLRLFLAGQAGGVPLPAGGGTTSMPTGEIPAGAFLGKSIPDAAKLYLQIMKRKASTREIADGLRKGGMESTSSNFYGIVHAILDRSRKAGGEIVKLDKATWGLAEWYPAGVRTTATSQKRPTGKKRGRPKGKAVRTVQTPTEPQSNAGSPKPGLEQRIGVLLLADKAKTFTIAEIAAALGVKSQGLALALGRMAKKNMAIKTDGGYRFSAGA
jgi:hypothetical protein